MLMGELIKSPGAISHVFAFAIFINLASSCGTATQIPSDKTRSAILKDSLLVDSDGYKYPLKVLLDGYLWMTSNLKLNIPGSYCYENIKANCDKYGRLYTWEIAQQGCKLLGEGWRLPGKDDWWQLTKLYGGFAGFAC